MIDYSQFGKCISDYAMKVDKHYSYCISSNLEILQERYGYESFLKKIYPEKKSERK